MDEIKPAVLIWVQPRAISRMPQGFAPDSWYYEKPDPSTTSSEYVQIIVPHDYFIQLLDQKLKLDIEARDLLL